MTVLQLLLLATAASFVATTVIGRDPRAAWPVALRIGFATLFTATGISHFIGLRADLVAMVPPVLPSPEVLVTVTGILELAGAVGLLLRPTAAWAAGGLGFLLIAMLPANVYAASAGITFAGEPPGALLPRAAEQGLYLAYAITIVATTRVHALTPKKFVVRPSYSSSNASTRRRSFSLRRQRWGAPAAQQTWARTRPWSISAKRRGAGRSAGQPSRDAMRGPAFGPPRRVSRDLSHR